MPKMPFPNSINRNSMVEPFESTNRDPKEAAAVEKADPDSTPLEKKMYVALVFAACVSSALPYNAGF
jgi:hypothetical protein